MVSKVIGSKAGYESCDRISMDGYRSLDRETKTGYVNLDITLKA